MSLVFKHIHSPTSWSLLNGTSAHFDNFITWMMLKTNAKYTSTVKITDYYLQPLEDIVMMVSCQNSIFHEMDVNFD